MVTNVIISLLGHVLQGEHETSTRPKQMGMGSALSALTSKQATRHPQLFEGSCDRVICNQLVSSFHAFVRDLHRFS